MAIVELVMLAVIVVAIGCLIALINLDYPEHQRRVRMRKRTREYKRRERQRQGTYYNSWRP